MVERPILFSGQMVRAILAGTKTQTRRVVKWPTEMRSLVPDWPRAWVEHGKTGKNFAATGEDYLHVPDTTNDTTQRVFSPYGAPGDRLWVRETWGVCPDYSEIRYRADRGMDRAAAGGRWRPSIFMRRADSRLTLEITEVRVQRLQAISEEDARAEGLPPVEKSAQFGRDSAKGTFAALWDSLNGKRPGRSWADNPWVWAISFRRPP